MRPRGFVVAALTVLISSPGVDLLAERGGRGPDIPIAVRPGTLGDLIDVLAGYSVRVPGARVVGVFDPRVLLIETQTPLRPLVGKRSRVIVLIETGTLRVEPALLVASTITVSGTARTLLGIQVTREVPWPASLTREAVERLEIRAAVLARSVTTVEGVDLLDRPSAGARRGVSVKAGLQP